MADGADRPSDHTVSLERGGGSATAETAPDLVLLLEGDRPTAPSSRHALGAVDRVRVQRGRERAARRGKDGIVRTLELDVPDRALSIEHAQLLRAGGQWVLEDRGSKNGCLLNGAPVRRAALEDGDLLELGNTFLLFRAASPSRPGDPDVDARDLEGAPLGIATFVPAFAEALELVSRVAATTIPVLLLGPTGSGKEVVARALHDASGRRGAFVPVNCGAITPSLVEAELFGHRRGAFTGAVDERPGFVRAADRGTLFLDEIGDLAAPAQATLLRVLQEREVVPVGDARAVKVDLRVVAATHRDLQARVAEGSFREDLLARLSGPVVNLPPLSERREDLGLLVTALIARHAGGAAPRLAPTAARALLQHDWPQNVRELDMALRTAIAVAGSGDARIELAHLPPALRSPEGTPRAPEPTPLGPEDEKIRAELLAELKAHAGNVAAVARAMGKGRMQIHRWLRRFGLDLEIYRR